MHFETQWGFHRSFCSLFARSWYGFWTPEKETHFGFWLLGSQGRNSLRVPEFPGTKPTPGSGLSGTELILGSGERNPLRVPGSRERNPLWVPDPQERNLPRVSGNATHCGFRIPKNGTHSGFRIPGNRIQPGFPRTELTPGFREQNPLRVQDSRKRHPLRVSDSRERNQLRFRVPENGTHPGFRGTEPETDTPI